MLQQQGRSLGSTAVAVVLMFSLAAFPVGCGEGNQYTSVRSPTPDEPVPESTRARLQECLNEYAQDLADGEYTVAFDMTLNGDDGRVREVVPKGTEVTSRDMQLCMRDALRAMVVPSFVLEQSVANLGAPVQARQLMGDVTAAAIGQVFVEWEPILVRAGPVGVYVIVTLGVVLTAAKLAEKDKEKRCRREEELAERQCRDMSGTTVTLYECMKDYISQECGGRVPNDAAGWRPGRRM